MKRMLIAGGLMCVLATPAGAARQVYLKDGGVIAAQSVWRSKGTVHVLVNRDTLTSFGTAEIDMKRTFPRHRKAVGKKSAPVAPQAAGSVPEGAGAGEKKPAAERKPAVSLPRLPSLPAVLPEKNPLPLGGGKEEGTIRKQKREMTERLNE